MELNIKVTDNIGCNDGRKPFCVDCFVSDDRISVGRNLKVNPAEVLSRLDELARKITDTVTEFYSSIEIPTSFEKTTTLVISI